MPCCILNFLTGNVALLINSVFKGHIPPKSLQLQIKNFELHMCWWSICRRSYCVGWILYHVQASQSINLIVHGESLVKFNHWNFYHTWEGVSSVIISTTGEWKYTELFGCGQGQFPIRYLGIPIHYQRLTIAEWKIVEERL
jgi:hypothetical protein